MVSVTIDASAAVTFGPPTTFPTRVAGRTSGLTRALDVLPDGRLVGLYPEDVVQETLDSNEIRVVINWAEELNQASRHRSGRRAG
jgi:hypothetical protein